MENQTTKSTDYFINKFQMKMSNSTPATSAWWIDGASELTDKEKQIIWKGIKDDIDWKSRDRQFEHADLPNWLIKII